MYLCICVFMYLCFYWSGGQLLVPTLVSDSGCTISSQPDPAPDDIVCVCVLYLYLCLNGSGCTISSLPDPAPNRADASHRQFGPSLIEVAHFSSHKSFLVVVKTILPMPEKEPDHQTQIYETIVNSKERNFVCSNLHFRWVGEKWLQALSPPLP